MEAMGPGEGVGGGGDGDGGGGEGVGGGGEGSGEEAGGGLEGGGEGGGAGQEVIVPDVPERPVAWKVHTKAELPTYTSPPWLPLLPEKLVVAMDVVPEEAYIPPPQSCAVFDEIWELSMFTVPPSISIPPP